MIDPNVRRNRLVTYAETYLMFLQDLSFNDDLWSVVDKLWLDMNAQDRKIATGIASALDKIIYPHGRVRHRPLFKDED